MAGRPVAPLAGAWIEIFYAVGVVVAGTSHPSRVRGLKCKLRHIEIEHTQVAPLAGAWIEIRTSSSITFISFVAPLAGAWIEIPYLSG